MFDTLLSEMLAEDLFAQLTRDAGRAYEIELALKTAVSPVARLALQREHASLKAVAS